MRITSNFNSKLVWGGCIHPNFVLYDYKAREFYDFVQNRKGYVYAMQHPDRVGLLKIGRTAKNPFVRAKTLGTAGILGAFELLWVAEFANAAWGEAAIHRDLQHCHEDKEFFRVSLDDVKALFSQHTVKEEDLLKDLNKDVLMVASYDDWISSLDIINLVDHY